jgi:hypothetical protein
MKIETLKTLIELIPSNSNDGDFVKEHVLKYIDLFEKDQELKQQFLNYPAGVRGFDPTEPLEVRYGEVCSCNPKNGGSGICGCTMGNTMVRNPKSIHLMKSSPSFPPQD